MKKAFQWLDKHKVNYTFHNYKESGISKAKLTEWLKHVDVSELANLKSATYRMLSEAEKKSITNKKEAIRLMMENNSLIKRPVVETSKGIVLGYNPEEWEKII